MAQSPGWGRYGPARRPGGRAVRARGRPSADSRAAGSGGWDGRLGMRRADGPPTGEGAFLDSRARGRGREERRDRWAVCTSRGGRARRPWPERARRQPDHHRRHRQLWGRPAPPERPRLPAAASPGRLRWPGLLCLAELRASVGGRVLTARDGSTLYWRVSPQAARRRRRCPCASHARSNHEPAAGRGGALEQPRAGILDSRSTSLRRHQAHRVTLDRLAVGI